MIFVNNDGKTPMDMDRTEEARAILSKAPCKRTQHCWPTTPNIVGCYMLVHVVAFCCAKFKTGKIFQPTTPNISFVP